MPRVTERASPGALKACWEASLDDHVIRLVWSRAGVIAAACIGGPIHLLHGATGVTLRVLEGHRAGTQCISWSHDGRLLASGGQDGKVRIWNPDSDEPVGVFDGGSSWVEQVSFAPDSHLLASPSGRNLKLRPRPGSFLTSGWHGQPRTVQQD